MKLTSFSVVLLNLLSVSVNAIPFLKHDEFARFTKDSGVAEIPGVPKRKTNDVLVNREEAYAFISDFWETFASDKNADEARKINSTFFTEDAVLKASMTGDFEGVELITEYAFAVFAELNPVSFQMFGNPINHTLVNFIFDDNFFAVSVIVTFYLSNIDFAIPVLINSVGYLDGSNCSQYQIAELDVTFQYFEEAYNLVANTTTTYLEAAYPDSTFTGAEIMKKLAIESICEVATEHCTGDNLQYSSYDDCVSELSTRRMGFDYEGGRDTIFCRNVHQVMLPLRPDVHCPHVGPSGGDMCRDRDTDYYYKVKHYQEFWPVPFLHTTDDQEPL